MSAPGAWPTSSQVACSVAIGGKADIPETGKTTRMTRSGHRCSATLEPLPAPIKGPMWTLRCGAFLGFEERWACLRFTRRSAEASLQRWGAANCCRSLSESSLPFWRHRLFVRPPWRPSPSGYWCFIPLDGMSNPGANTPKAFARNSFDNRHGQWRSLINRF